MLRVTLNTIPVAEFADDAPPPTVPLVPTLRQSRALSRLRLGLVESGTLRTPDQFGALGWLLDQLADAIGE